MDDISYSVFLEKNNQNKYDILKYTLPRRIYTWTDDSSVSNCHACSREFSFFYRRHHCRYCGKIFCAACTNFQAYIPLELLSEDSLRESWHNYFSKLIFKTNQESEKYKVCKPCLNLIGTINTVKNIIEIFFILNLDIFEIKKLGFVCKLWSNATAYILSIFREIQYKLPMDIYSDFEKKLLWNNSEYLTGHSKYLVSLFKTCEPANLNNLVNIYKKSKKINCWSLMCTRSCSQKFNSYDIINILCDYYRKIQSNKFNIKLKYLLEFTLELLSCPDQEFRCYIPLFAYYLRFDGYFDKNSKILSKFLITRSANNFVLLNSLYWELQLYPKDNYHELFYSDILNKLKIIFNQDTNFTKIIEGYTFIKILENISKNICEDSKNYDEIKDNFNLKQELLNPLNPNIKIRHICLDKIEIKNSASQPIIIPCEISNGNIIKFLYKKGDMRRDQIIMSLMVISSDIIKSELKLDPGIIFYEILPISKSTGIIEIIDNCDTIYYIQEKLKSTILNYIIENNADIKIRDIKDKFIKSTAAYCVITYLLGIGDRHLDNIMITKDGRLFHIDFSYILGMDPLFNNTGIRVTTEMTDAIGGINSKYYQIYVDICTKIYNCLRRYIDIYLNILLILPYISDIKLSELEIKDQLIKRFIPGENQIDAKIHLVKQIENQSYIDKLKDWFHYHSKEKTLNRLSQTISNIIKN